MNTFVNISIRLIAALFLSLFALPASAVAEGDGREPVIESRQVGAPIAARGVTIAARVARADGSPAPGAVVVSSAGGRGVADDYGIAHMEVMLSPEAEAVHVTAAATEWGVFSTGSVRAAALGKEADRIDAGVITLVERVESSPEWITTFAGWPGGNSPVRDLAVYGDDSEAGAVPLAVGEITDSAETPDTLASIAELQFLNLSTEQDVSTAGTPPPPVTRKVRFNNGVANDGFTIDFGRASGTRRRDGIVVPPDVMVFDHASAIASAIPASALLTDVVYGNSLVGSSSGFTVDGTTVRSIQINSGNNTISMGTREVPTSNADRFNVYRYSTTTGVQPFGASSTDEIARRPWSTIQCYGLSVAVSALNVWNPDASARQVRGMSIVWSVDDGATWTPVDFYRDPSEWWKGMGQSWTSQNYYVRQRGENDPTEVFIPCVDYMHKSGNPASGMVALLRATRPAPGATWNTPQVMLLDHVVGGIDHFHSAAVAFDSTTCYVLYIGGDGTDKASIMRRSIPLTAFDSDAWLDESNWTPREFVHGVFGEQGIDADRGYQGVAFGPGRTERHLLIGADLGSGALHEVDGTASVLRPKLVLGNHRLRPGGNECFHMHVFDSHKGTNGATWVAVQQPRANSQGEGSSNRTYGPVCVSRDGGESWAQVLNNQNFSNQPAFMTGVGSLYMMGKNGSQQGGVGVPPFEIVSGRPLLLRPGVRSRVATDINVNAEGPNVTVTELTEAEAMALGAPRPPVGGKFFRIQADRLGTSQFNPLASAIVSDGDLDDGVPVVGRFHVCNLNANVISLRSIDESYGGLGIIASAGGGSPPPTASLSCVVSREWIEMSIEGVKSKAGAWEWALAAVNQPTDIIVVFESISDDTEGWANHGANPVEGGNGQSAPDLLTLSGWNGESDLTMFMVLTLPRDGIDATAVASDMYPICNLHDASDPTNSVTLHLDPANAKLVMAGSYPSAVLADIGPAYALRDSQAILAIRVLRDDGEGSEVTVKYSIAGHPIHALQDVGAHIVGGVGFDTLMIGQTTPGAPDGTPLGVHYVSVYEEALTNEEIEELMMSLDFIKGIPEGILGDVNGDGVVDFHDLAIVLGQFGQSG
ncbi:MAG: hypothetical protein EA379_10755, partial [Phycisphaerales bacterium]